MGEFKKFGSRKNNDRAGRGFRVISNNSEKPMVQVVCDECGKKCEVPFKPSGDKPVYCNDCFAKMKNQGLRRGFENGQRPLQHFSDTFPESSKKKFDTRVSVDSGNNFYRKEYNFTDIKIELEALNAKIDKLILLQAKNTELKPASIPEKKSEKIENVLKKESATGKGDQLKSEKKVAATKKAVKKVATKKVVKKTTTKKVAKKK